jgi:methyl-accepting chemotaxis protein
MAAALRLMPDVDGTLPSADDLEHLCDHGGADVYVHGRAPLSAAIDMFCRDAELRLLPVVDERQRPVGAIFEPDVRAILYNPYGHALLSNPSFNGPAQDHCRPCPTAERTTPLPALLDIHARGDGSEGVILTENGRLIGLITNRTLIRLAAMREARIASARMARLERAAAAGDRFIADISLLAEALSRVAAGIEGAAAATADRAGFYRARAAAVAGAATQTASGMRDLAGQGQGLAATVEQVRTETSNVRQAASEAVALSASSLERGQALAAAATAIGGTLASVQAISSQAKLLAINAAIEAARLGDRGSGFAVVARELKQFAIKTQSAASDIADRVGGIHQASTQVVEGQRAIGDAVGTIRDATGAVDDAVGIHGSTARLLADNVGQALRASTDITANVGEISDMVAHAVQGVEAMRGMANDLGSEIARLRNRVDGFLQELRQVG